METILYELRQFIIEIPIDFLYGKLAVPRATYCLFHIFFISLLGI